LNNGGDAGYNRLASDSEAIKDYLTREPKPAGHVEYYVNK